MDLPTIEAFHQALTDYRRLYPKEGYVYSTMRFARTFAVFRQHYRGGVVVDVGTWPGDFALVLASLKLPIQVIDKDLARLTGRERDPATGTWMLAGSCSLGEKFARSGVPAFECDIERSRFPFEDASVDFVLCTDVIAHLRLGLLNTLEEIRRILKPEGRLLISTPNLLSLRNRLSFLLGKADYDTMQMPYQALKAEKSTGHGGIFRTFSMPEVVDLLEQTGFTVRFKDYYQFTPDNEIWLPRSLFGLRKRMANVLTRWIAPLRGALFVVAQPAAKLH